MAARSNPFFDIAEPAHFLMPDIAATPAATLAHLAQLHDEAVETSRLANLLGRSLGAAIALGALAIIVLLLGGGAGMAQTVSWSILMGIGVLAMMRAYTHAIGQPFERATLHAFAQDLRACLLYAGFAWGAGAFLALPSDAHALAALAFAGVPALVLGLLLRERQSALLFLAPLAALTSLACVTRPFAGGTLAAAVVLAALGILAWALSAAARDAAKRDSMTLPHALAS